jgi:hypothetical protein
MDRRQVELYWSSNRKNWPEKRHNDAHTFSTRAFVDMVTNVFILILVMFQDLYDHKDQENQILILLCLCLVEWVEKEVALEVVVAEVLGIQCPDFLI